MLCMLSDVKTITVQLAGSVGAEPQVVERLVRDLWGGSDV